MIIETGRQLPTPAQKRMVRAVADDSFMNSLPKDIGNVPCGDRWRHDVTTGITLRMRSVDPHKDDWVGCGPRPLRYAAVFWLVDMPRYSLPIILQVGAVIHKMVPGDYVIFDDRVLHSVVAHNVWYGCAYQVRPIAARAKAMMPEKIASKTAGVTHAKVLA